MADQFFVSAFKRRVRVVVHETQAELAAAAVKHCGEDDGYSTSGAIFHPAFGLGDYYGTIRLSKQEMTLRLTVHECFHLVSHIAREDEDFEQWALVYGEKEEGLAYLLDKFVYSLWEKLQTRYL